MQISRSASRPIQPDAAPKSSTALRTPLRDAFESIAAPAHSAQASLLSDNLQAWNARWKLLESARETVHAHKALQGLQVRVMVDAVGDTFGQRGFRC